MREHDYTRRLWRWLERFGFTDDPFAVSEADQERGALPFLFIDRPYAVSMIGDPARPQTAFLLAGPGAGKTATREMVAYECMHGRIRRRALPVRYCDFTSVLEQAGNLPEQITIRHHVSALVRVILKALAEDVPEIYFDALDESARSFLLGYASRFASSVTQLKLNQLVVGQPTQLNWDNLSPIETMEGLVHIITQLGQSSTHHFEALYVLVDRVDETSAGPGSAAQILKPLIAEGAILGLPQTAFKFFLPLEVGEQLDQTLHIRRDRIRIETISWDNETLRELIEERLAYYSQNRIEHLAQICSSGSGAAILSRLLNACDKSPRTLLRLCEAVIRFHVTHSDDAFLSPKDVTAALVEFNQQLEAEQLTAPLTNKRGLIGRERHAPPARGLFIDEGDHVWVDGELLPEGPSGQEFRLLKALYKVAPAIVSQDDLIAAVWDADYAADENELRVSDEQNLRKLVDRLRQRLEPKAKRGAWRFVRNARGRGYWLITK